MIIRSTLILTALALPLAAQDNADVNSFYKAYFLDKSNAKDQKASAKAIELYSAFLAANKDHKLAPHAAANCVVLLYASGDVKKAEAFAKQHGAMMASVEAKNAEANDPMRMLRGMGRGGAGGGEENPNQATIDKLLGLHENADETGKIRLAAAITRLGGGRALMMRRFRGGGRGGFGGGNRGGGRRGGGGGFTKPNIAEMKQEDAKAAVEKMVNAAERIVDFMAQRGQADEADKLESKLDKVQDLVDDGKMKEAQKIIDTIEVNQGRGGQQGGRRRRGGDAGGAGAGGAGAGGAGGERRRRRG